jgi:hypothetical protein
MVAYLRNRNVNKRTHCIVVDQDSLKGDEQKIHINTDVPPLPKRKGVFHFIYASS